MIDIIPKHLFMEKDILHVEFGQYKQQGVERFAVAVDLRGRQKPVIGVYDSYVEMTSVVSQIEAKWRAAEGQAEEGSMMKAFSKMQERMEETEKKLAEWEKAGRKQAAGGKGKTKVPGKKKAPKEFNPPTDDEMVDYINGNEELKEILTRVGNTAEKTVAYFRSLYEKEKETGEKDENGFSIRIIYWEDSAGKPVKDWKNKLRQHILHADVFDERARSRAAARKPASRPAKENQFTRGVENNAYDFDLLEEELAGMPAEERHEESEQKQSIQEDRKKDHSSPAQAEGLPA